jgi:hypothetical protein
MSENQETEKKKLSDDTSNKSGEVLSIFDANISETPIKLELKPITDGLGFKDRVSSGVYTEEIQPLKGISTADAGVLDIGREDQGDGEIYVEDDSLRLQSSEVLRPVLFHSGHDGLIKKKEKKGIESFFAVFIDLTLCLSGSILVLAFFMDFLGFNSLESFLLDPKTAGLNFVAIFLAFYLTYKILSRAFYGRSLGEWSCRLQMGNLKDQQRFIYTFQVALRELVSIATGLFVLPLVSIIFSVDVGYYVSGLHVYIEKKMRS